jgi:hypothetical protein
VIKTRQIRSECLRYGKVAVAEPEEEPFAGWRIGLRPQSLTAENRSVDEGHVELRSPRDVRHPNVDVIESDRLHDCLFGGAGMAHRRDRTEERESAAPRDEIAT